MTRNKRRGTNKRPDDMPLTGRLVRERKGMYVCMITFTKSKRAYTDEIVYAKDVKQARAYIKRQFPTLKWKKRV